MGVGWEYIITAIIIPAGAWAGKMIADRLARRARQRQAELDANRDERARMQLEVSKVYQDQIATLRRELEASTRALVDTASALKRAQNLIERLTRSEGPARTPGSRER